MKKIVIRFSALILILLLISFGQEAIAQKPMGNIKYKCYYKKLEKVNNDEKRLKKGVKKLRQNYISSNQLYKVMNLFDNDDFKLAYIKDIYSKISDKSNSILLIDAFEKESHTIILWEYIKFENPKYNVPVSNLDSYADYLKLNDKKKDKQYDEKTTDNENTSTITGNKEVKNNEKDIITELIIFPDASLYKGKKGCDKYLNENEFSAFKKAFSQVNNDEEKTKIFMEYVYKYCFTTSQVMELSYLLTGDNYKYIFFKTAYDKIYDPEDFNYVTQLLESDDLIQSLEKYLKESDNISEIDGKEANFRCLVTSEDLLKVKSEIRKEYSSDNKVETAKKMIKQYKCFSSEQISGLLSLFSFEADKLDIAKFAYEYTVDKGNYYKVINHFTKYELKEELKEYLKRFE